MLLSYSSIFFTLYTFNFFLLTSFYCVSFYKYLYITVSQTKSHLFNYMDASYTLTQIFNISILLVNIISILSVSSQEIIFLSLFIFVYNNLFKSLQLTAVYGIIYLWFINVYILMVENIWEIYLLVELSSYLFIYFMLTSNNTQVLKIYHNIIFYFILNFYSSLLLFLSITFLYYIYGYFFYSLTSLSCVFFYLFFFLKIAAGPWLIWNYSFYKGLPLEILILYSIIFFLALVPKFIELLVVLGGTTFYLYIIIILYSLYIYTYIFNIISLKIFLASSSSIFLIFVLFALISA